MIYPQRGGDGEGARLDLREKVQEIVHFEFCCGVREICQDLQQQGEQIGGKTQMKTGLFITQV